ncbi:MAG: hypothetical protein AAB794_02950 [Patescibacteria group bacterium]
MSLSDKELRVYSGEHLLYEIEMMLDVLQVDTSNLPPRFRGNMTVELFGLHLRNLITFLYPTRNQQDTDVYARDYFSDKGEWERIAPPLSATLDTARRRANKELGHLTTERIDGFQDRKKWGIASLTEEIVPILQLFCSSANKLKLDDSVAQLVSPSGFHLRRAVEV